MLLTVNATSGAAWYCCWWLCSLVDEKLQSFIRNNRVDKILSEPDRGRRFPTPGLTWLTHTSKLVGRVTWASAYVKAWCQSLRQSLLKRVTRAFLRTLASAEIFPGSETSTFCYLFHFADVAMQTDVYKALYCFYTTKKMPHESTRSIRTYFEIFFKWSCIGVPICHNGVLSVILYRFCWIGAYSRNWVWNGLELSINTFAVLSLVFNMLNRTHFWNLLSELFTTLRLSEMLFLFMNFLMPIFETTFYK